MAFSFSPTLASPIDRVRQLIGDTVEVGHQVPDETITAYLTSKAGSEIATAAQLAWDLASKWAKMVDAEVDNQEIKASQRYANYVKLAERLDAQGGKPVSKGGGYGGIIVTGVGDCRGPNLSMPDCYE